MYLIVNSFVLLFRTFLILASKIYWSFISMSNDQHKGANCVEYIFVSICIVSKLHFSWSCWIALILRLLAFYRHLTELALLYCQRISNCALSEVGKGCKNLQALHLVDCSSVGDDAISNIGRGCRNLKKLHIRRCYEVCPLILLGLRNHLKICSQHLF